ncbi:glycosyltransferase [Deinococcus malanensis]|uniref:glycosyltransferase n=1 Tax=Deinococcus malanensis TaxID=1706855 RepID=UPI00362CC6AC
MGAGAGRLPGWSLKIIGTGEEEEALRAQAASLGLERWALAPQTSHIEQEYRNAGVFVLPSRFEGLPMVLIESQAHGVPAVAFDCLTGPAEIFETGEECWCHWRTWRALRGNWEA